MRKTTVEFEDLTQFTTGDKQPPLQTPFEVKISRDEAMIRPKEDGFDWYKMRRIKHESIASFHGRVLRALLIGY